MHLENMAKVNIAKHRKTNSANSAGSQSWALRKMTGCQGFGRGGRGMMVKVNEISAS